MCLGDSKATDFFWNRGCTTVKGSEQAGSLLGHLAAPSARRRSLIHTTCASNRAPVSTPPSKCYLDAHTYFQTPAGALRSTQTCAHGVHACAKPCPHRSQLALICERIKTGLRSMTVLNIIHQLPVIT